MRDRAGLKLAVSLTTNGAELAAVLDPSFVHHPHVDLIAETLAVQWALEGSRSILNMPPRHGKTHTTAWALVDHLRRHPRDRIIFVSYSAELAARTARMVRNIVERHGDVLGIKLAADSKAADRWDLTTGGGLLAAGIESRIVGWGADVAVVDDPHSDIGAARNKAAADKVHNYYTGTLLTRLQSGGRVTLVGHRLAPADLFGRVLEDDPGAWHVLALSALATKRDPLGRRKREALAPAMMPKRDLKRREREVGPIVWGSMYQQAPSASDGGMFPATAEDWRSTTRADLDPKRRLVRAWDMAATQGGGDYTVGALLSYSRSTGTYVIEDVVRFQGSPSEVEKRIAATAQRDGSKVAIRIDIDPGAAGKAVAERFTRSVLAGYTVIAEHVRSSKWERALPASAAALSGELALLQSDLGTPARWWADLVVEAAGFPGGAHDDQIDAVTSGFNWLQKRAARGRAKGHTADPRAFATPLVGPAGSTFRRPSASVPTGRPAGQIRSVRAPWLMGLEAPEPAPRPTRTEPPKPDGTCMIKIGGGRRLCGRPVAATTPFQCPAHHSNVPSWLVSQNPRSGWSTRLTDRW